MPNISDSLQLTRFTAALEQCKQAPYGVLSDWDRQFVSDIADRFEARDTQADLGLTLWNPSVNQWNQLMQIRDKVQAS